VKPYKNPLEAEKTTKAARNLGPPPHARAGGCSRTPVAIVSPDLPPSRAREDALARHALTIFPLPPLARAGGCPSQAWFNILPASPPRARGRMAALIVAVVLLTAAPQLYAQGRTATSSLALQVRPEELLQEQNGSVALKIRLARGTTAGLWAGNSCASPSPQSHVITMSGIYSIPYSALTPVSSNPSPSTMQVCLESSDGVLNDSLSVEILGTGNGAAMQGSTPVIAPSGVLVEVPAGWMVTAGSGTTTQSNP